MNPHYIQQAISPLRMIFWGGLLCVFDFSFSRTVNGNGFKFDILNDFVGSILIAIGLSSLARAPVHERYATVMLFVQVVAVIAVFDSLREHFILPLSPPVHLILNVLDLVYLASIVAFCIAMRWFCETAALPTAANSWSTTTSLFVLLYLLPLGAVHLLTMFTIATGTSFNINLGPAGLLLLPLFAVPLIHLFVSTSRMQSAAELAPISKQPPAW
jgi:hypothetical protein